MNRVSGFIIIITGALVRISEYHIILDILIKSRYTAVQNFPRYPTLSYIVSMCLTKVLFMLQSPLI